MNKTYFCRYEPKDNRTIEKVFAFGRYKIKELYSVWNQVYCKGQVLKYEGLKDEPYFKYFLYAPFLTPNSGLIQIKKYAEMENAADLLDLFAQISTRTKKVKEEIYRMLVEDFKYFE